MRETIVGSLDIVRRGFPLLLIGLAVDAAFIFVFLIALQSYLPESLHASKAIAGVALAAFGVAKLLTQLASGFISDRLGARRALILVMIAYLAAEARRAVCPRLYECRSLGRPVQTGAERCPPARRACSLSE